MTGIKKVAIFGATGNFGSPITAALADAGFDLTIISRSESTAVFPDGIPVVRTNYASVDALKAALAGQDAAVCAVGPAGIASQSNMIDAAEAAGIKRFIVSDFGWGPNVKSLPEFKPIGESRRKIWDYADEKAKKAGSSFSWSGISCGNPIDWALPRFPLFGFDLNSHDAIIYDNGTESWTATTLEGIGQAVVGTLQHPQETANRHVLVRSLQVCQNDLLAAFEEATGEKWTVKRDTTAALIKRGREKHVAGTRGWILELMVGQMLEEGVGRAIVATKEMSDNKLVGVREETPLEVVKKALELAKK